MPFSTIAQGPIALRQFVAADAPKILAYRSRAEVSRYQSWGIETQSQILSQIESLAALEPGVRGPWYQLGIVLRASGEFLGDCGFHVAEADSSQAEFGISLDPRYQRHGYATEALHALLDYLLVTLGMYRVFASVGPRNVRAIDLMRRVGMRKEAHFGSSLWFKSEWVDDVIFAMLASERQATRGR
jgi:RimJ/RimL family protein N-acetyltransferase